MRIKHLCWFAAVAAIALLVGRTSMRDTRFPAPEDQAAFDRWVQQSSVHGTTTPTTTSATVLRMYDVADIMAHVAAFYDHPPQVSISSPQVNPGPVIKRNPTLQDHQNTLATLIEDVVMNETWRVNGGNVGWIKFIGGRMLVLQTPEAQATIAKLLQQVREGWQEPTAHD